jgi:glutathione S-transferase
MAMTAADDIILYDAAGVPGPRRVRICLLEKGLSFTSRWMNLALMDQKHPAYLELNPMGLVPTLLHRGEVIFDSNVINEYLDALYPEPRLVPSDPRGQAEMRMWFAFEGDFAKPFRDASYEMAGKARIQNTGLTAEELRAEIGKRTNNEAYQKFARNVLTAPRDEGVIADRLAVILEKIGAMERRLGDGRAWLCGDAFTLADIAVVPRMDLFGSIGVADLHDRFPRIGAWMGRLKQRPSWPASAILPEPGETERHIAA